MKPYYEERGVTIYHIPDISHEHRFDQFHRFRLNVGMEAKAEYAELASRRIIEDCPLVNYATFAATEPVGGDRKNGLTEPVVATAQKRRKPAKNGAPE